MAPFQYNYILIAQPNREVADRFVERYVHKGNFAQGSAETVEHFVDLALATPPRAFYQFLPTRERCLAGAYVGLTADGQLLLGVALNDPLGTADARRRAKRWLRELAMEFGAAWGCVGVEEPPPLDGGLRPHGSEYGRFYLLWPFTGKAEC